MISAGRSQRQKNTSLFRFCATILQIYVLSCQISQAQSPPHLTEEENGRKRLKDLITTFYSEPRPTYVDNDHLQGAPVSIRIEEKASIEGGSPARISPRLTSQGNLEILLEITREGLRSPEVVVEQESRLGLIFQPIQPVHNPVFPEEFAELYWNAEAGSKKARAALALWDKTVAESVLGSFQQADTQSLWGPLSPEAKAQQEKKLQEKAIQAKSTYERALKEAVADHRAQMKKWTERKPKLDQHEKQEEKLNHAVAKNDRPKVASLLRDYLPWELMEPSESRYWRGVIEAIEFPDPKRSVLLYRGLDEYDRRAFDNNQGSLFSTLLNRNQGNYSRRLRSFASKRTSFQPPILSPNTEGSIPSLCVWSTGPYCHSLSPEGSPYLSFTKSGSTAGSFASHGIVAVQVDSRKILPSWVSAFPAEAEHLLPLIVFPDEIAVARTYDASEAQDFAKKAVLMKEFYDEVQSKTGIHPLHGTDPLGFTQAELVRPYELLGAEGPDFQQSHLQIRKCLLDAFSR